MLLSITSSIIRRFFFCEMAWLSVGNNNDELIAQMKENGVLDDDLILDAFRQVDRGDFVKKEDRYTRLRFYLI